MAAGIKKKIVYASTRDRCFFPELWNPQAFAVMDKLKLEVKIPDFNEAKANSERWAEFLAGADAVITTWASPCIDRHMLEAAPDLQIIGHAAGSVAGYVRREVFEAGIKVVSANDNMAHAVAEWCLAGGLMGLRNIISNANFGGHGKLDFPGRSNCRSFRGSTVGIWGYGAVAAHLIKMLKPLLPAEILIYSNHLSEPEAAGMGLSIVSLDELLVRSEVIYTLAGLNKRTEGMINGARLALIRDHAVLVNAGRGQLIVEKDLYAALNQRRFTAVLDVYHEEPLPPENPLQTMPNVILTPHNAGYPSRFSYIPTILKEIHRCFKGNRLSFEIKPEQLAFMTINPKF